MASVQTARSNLGATSSVSAGELARSGDMTEELVIQSCENMIGKSFTIGTHEGARPSRFEREEVI